MKKVLVLLPAFALGILASANGAIGAEPVSRPELGDAVPGHPGVTFLDLARMVVPDLAGGGDGYFGGAPAGLRQIDGFDWDGGGEDRTGPVRAAAVPYKAAGKDRLAVLFELVPEGEAALALYDLSGAPKLLDAADIALDRMTGFAEPARLATGPGDDVLIVDGKHFNSNQGYAATTLFGVFGDRIAPIDTIYTLDERGCAHRRTQQLSYSVTAKVDGHGPIAVKIVDRVEATGEQCDAKPPAPSRRTIKVTYRWNGGYKPDSDAFARLAQENEKRF